MMVGISQSFLSITPGTQVLHGGRKYRITHVISIDSVLAVDVLTQEKKRLRIETLMPCMDETNPSPVVRDVTEFSAEEWQEAQRRFESIKPLLDDPIRTRATADALALQAGVHATTLYKWLRDYQNAGHVSALVPVKRGRKSGTRLLDGAQESVIDSVIEDLYLSKQRHTPQDVIDEVQRRCRLAKIVAPHGNTVRNRIKALEQRTVLRRRGRKDLARNLYDAIQGEFPGATHPYAVVQIDHTPANIILVDEVYRKPIGKPWLTLAIDVYSRMIAALYITFEHPSATSVGICLANAICPKREYLAELGVSGEWPVWGVMDVVHSDNGKEFRGKVLRRACENYGIDLQWRPVMLPHMGGHVERLMGVAANEIRKLPGTTFSNPSQRKGYDSESTAALTLKEFERHLVDFIVNVYHQRVHSGINMSPKRKWELGVIGDDTKSGTGILPIPEDPGRIRLDFMPYFERSVQTYGIQVDNIRYYDPVLEPYINAMDPGNPKAKREFLVRRDPRDISKIYFLDPSDNRYSAIPYRNIAFPAMSAWELNEITSKLKEEGRKDVDEDLIFEALNRMRANIEASKAKTKAARRKSVRTPPLKPKLSIQTSADNYIATPQVSESQFVDDPFAMDIQPFDEVSLSR